MDDLDLDAIRARATAAGGADARWVQPDPVRASGRVESRDGDIIVYDEGCPSREQAAHIAGMDPATTLALLDALEIRKAVGFLMVDESGIERAARAYYESPGSDVLAKTGEWFPTNWETLDWRIKEDIKTKIYDAIKGLLG